jgi:hypothetical protein
VKEQRGRLGVVDFKLPVCPGEATKQMQVYRSGTLNEAPRRTMLSFKAAIGMKLSTGTTAGMLVPHEMEDLSSQPRSDAVCNW